MKWTSKRIPDNEWRENFVLFPMPMVKASDTHTIHWVWLEMVYCRKDCSSVNPYHWEYMTRHEYAVQRLTAPEVLSQ